MIQVAPSSEDFLNGARGVGRRRCTSSIERSDREFGLFRLRSFFLFVIKELLLIGRSLNRELLFFEFLFVLFFFVLFFLKDFILSCGRVRKVGTRRREFFLELLRLCNARGS